MNRTMKSSHRMRILMASTALMIGICLALASSVTSLYTLTQKHLSDCKVNFGRKTFDEKKYCLERFYKSAGNIDIIDVDPLMVLDFVNKRAKSQSNNAANKDRKNLKAFYTWVQEKQDSRDGL